MSDFPHPKASHIPDFLEDRGPAEYFHGRTKILDNFGKLLERAVQTNRGTVFLIQGAPGAGKTALLHELEKLGLASGWETPKKKMYPSALWTPGELRKSFGQNIRAKFSGTGGIGIQVAQIGVKTEWTQATTLNILSSGKKPLLLKLDEAQTIGTTNAPPSNLAGVATNVLDAIHNGELGRPVILMAAGLGQTEEAFRLLGISRFRGGCFVELGALSKDSERAVIHDWIIKEGGAKGDPVPWIDMIAQKTHGWPQHISAYGDAAAKQIEKDNGNMTSAGLEVVYKLGKDRCESYYKQRAEKISRKERGSLAWLVENISVEGGIDKEDIEAALSQEYDSDKARDLFKRLLERGILHSQDGVYTIPIPSMRTWLISNYARERARIPHAP
ncbi:MAG: hypothetical protein OXE92_03515 [Bacteroidetes bacterium]|nr:hypothetical protein [Bacteroidota bacterium]